MATQCEQFGDFGVFKLYPKMHFATHHIKQDSLLITQCEPSPYRTFGTLPAVLMLC